MPKSRIRRKSDFTPPSPKVPRGSTGGANRLVVPIMLTLLLVGLAWIVVYYIAGSSIPVMQDLGGWNLMIGMGLITGGFIAATQWK